MLNPIDGCSRGRTGRRRKIIPMVAPQMKMSRRWAMKLREESVDLSGGLKGGGGNLNTTDINAARLGESGVKPSFCPGWKRSERPIKTAFPLKSRDLWP
jgi:hypothetical protein